MNTASHEEFWSKLLEEVLHEACSRPQGLGSDEAAERLAGFGPNLLKETKSSSALHLLLQQFVSPIMLLLIFAALLSSFLHDATDAAIILAIVALSGALGFFQERKAAEALRQLLAIVQIDVQVLRDGKEVSVPLRDVVPGDVAVLNAGDTIPGDARILESKDLFADEAPVTGESYPVEKNAGVVPADTSLHGRSNCLWMGTHVVSGTAKAIVVLTGKRTLFGAISQRLKLRQPETDFEHGVRRFGYFLLEITLMMTLAIFAFNVFLQRPVLDSFLFALALAVGLTPQLLPAIISVNLAQGARRMASRKVIVKRLSALENFGSMDILCSDKTGTLTEGSIRLDGAIDIAGKESPRLLQLALLNASMQTGYANAMDAAIVEGAKSIHIANWRKLDEIPYDFTRRRVSVLVEENGKTDSRLIVTKGAFPNVLAACSTAQRPDGTCVPLAEERARLTERFESASRNGSRVLAVACRNFSGAFIDRAQEAEMTFAGLLLFTDPLREGVAGVVQDLKRLGVSLKIVTGDNALVAAHVSAAAHIIKPRVMTGRELRLTSDQALVRCVTNADVFAEVEPNQKERIILALRKAGHVVGYIGDGINDAPALHAADVSISVSNAVDVAKEAADIVLLEKDLAVLERGVRDGRATFANTLKYVFMATSANFGNMFSMAGASLFLSFLPLLPKQILLTNLLTDFPEMTIATDSVDRELVEKPRRWDLKFIRRFMLVFGLLSSVFDYLTFAVLLWVFHAGIETFRTGWFTESVISASLIVLVVRTRRPFVKSRPSRPLFLTTLLVVIATLILPWTPIATLLGLAALPFHLLAALLAIVFAYVIAAELAKTWFYRNSTPSL